MNSLALNYLTDELRRLKALSMMPSQWHQALEVEHWPTLLYIDKAIKHEPIDYASPQAFLQQADYIQHAMIFQLRCQDLLEYQESLFAQLQNLAEHADFAQLASERISYYRFLGICLCRIIKKNAIETFEEEISEIDWPHAAHSLRSRYSFWIGFVYQNEQVLYWKNKCRPWYEKAIVESNLAEQSVCQAFLFYYFLTTPDVAETDPIKRSYEMLRKKLGSQQQHHCCVELMLAELELAWLRYISEQPASREIKLEAIKALTDQAAITLGNPVLNHDIAVLILAQYKIDGLLARAHSESGKEATTLYDQTLVLIEKSISIAELFDDQASISKLYLCKGDVYIHKNHIREGQRMYREALTMSRKLDLPNLWPKAFESLIGVQLKLDSSRKAMEQLGEGFQFALKRLSDGGFSLFLSLLRYTNNILERENKKPGLGWITSELEGIFSHIESLHEKLHEHIEAIGCAKFSYYQEEYLRFEPFSTWHTKVHLRYQFQQIKVLQLAALFSSDAKAYENASRLIRSLSSPTNPLHIIQANWSDFKDVPNFVRNQILNRSISITKGDLPLAAEHLNFSYRNLRSYITNNEVNRLGFFLEELNTNSRPMELGIRLLFHDLYEKGTLFEVVFDMPAFIVQNSATGFSTPDMEDQLNIKYNTAKKYLKIMADAGIIEPEKNPHRKGHYNVVRDQIIARYLKHKEAREAHQQQSSGS